MKKLLCAVLVLMALVCSASSEIIAVPLSGLSQDELIALRDQIHQELLDRGIEKEVLVPMGVYTVGTDIPAGTYTVKPVSMEGTLFELYADEAMTDALMSDYLSTYTGNYIGKVELKEGNVVVIENANLTFAPYQGLAF